MAATGRAVYSIGIIDAGETIRSDIMSLSQVANQVALAPWRTYDQDGCFRCLLGGDPVHRLTVGTAAASV